MKKQILEFIYGCGFIITGLVCFISFYKDLDSVKNMGELVWILALATLCSYFFIITFKNKAG